MRKTMILAGVVVTLATLAVYLGGRQSSALPHDGQNLRGVAPRSGAQPKVDLVIALDTSGSMDGLINAARQKLWDVVNKVAQAQPTPRLRVGLLTYGNSTHPVSDGWVVVQNDLTTDLDTINAKLFSLTTNGGSEYVARAVHRAATALTWDDDPSTLRQIYVAGNEPANQDPVISLQAALHLAARKGIFVNAIYCGGGDDSDAGSWRTVAQLGEGLFASINQNQTVAVATPYDERLNQLSARLNGTYEGYGAGGTAGLARQAEQDVLARRAHASTGASRALAKASSVYDNASWDLVDAKKKGKLASIPKEALPASLQSLSDAELQQHLAKKAAEREAIQQQIREFSNKREAHIASEMKRQGLSTDQSFDQAVKNALVEQAAKKKLVLN